MSDKKPYETKTPEVKPEVPATPAVSDAQAYVRAMMEEMMPALIVAARSGNASAPAAPRNRHQEAADIQEIQYAASQKCQDCGQKLAGCKGEHEMIVVYPTKYPQYADYFQGRFINGVRYLSNHAGHKVCVPKNAAGDIIHAIAIAEEEEVAARTKRVKERNSGDVSSPKNFNPAVDGFR